MVQFVTVSPDEFRQQIEKLVLVGTAENHLSVKQIRSVSREMLGPHAKDLPRDGSVVNILKLAGPLDATSRELVCCFVVRRQIGIKMRAKSLLFPDAKLQDGRQFKKCRPRQPVPLAGHHPDA